MFNMTDASLVKFGGIAGDVISGFYSAKQIGAHAEAESAEIRRVAAANAALTREDSIVAMKQASELRKKVERDVAIRYEQINNLIGAQRAGFANANVVVSEGSASHIQSETARLGKIDADIIFHNGMNDVNRAKDLAQRYRSVSTNKLSEGIRAAYLIESAAGIKMGNVVAEGVSKASKSIYDVGVTEGWWGAPKVTPVKTKPYAETYET